MGAKLLYRDAQGHDVSGAEVIDHIQPFDGKWPELTPFRIRLSELPAPEPPAPPTPPTIAPANTASVARPPTYSSARAVTSGIGASAPTAAQVAAVRMRTPAAPASPWDRR